MSAARYSIGIDLGTTNSALAYAPLAGDVASFATGQPRFQQNGECKVDVVRRLAGCAR